MTGKPQGVASSAIAGMRWNYLGTLASTLSSVVISTVLARILGPGPFGQAIVAITVYALVNLFVDGGFSQALIQHKEISDDHIRRTFTCQVLIGVASTVLVYLAAPLIAALFHVAGVVPVIRAISLLMTVQSAGLVSSALLRREMRFRVLQYATLVSYLVSYLGVGIPLALAGKGVWSLVAAYLCQATLNSAFLYAAARHPITPVFGLPPRSIAVFGGIVMANSLVYWGHTNLDNLAASYRGPTALGLYGRACNLAYQPCNALVASLQSVLLSSAAKVSDKTELVGRIALASMVLVLGILGPAYAAFIAAPSTVIIGLYGHKWVAAIPLMVPIALAMPLLGSIRVLNPIICGVGRPTLEFWPQAVSCVLAAAAYFTAVHYSVLAVAWALLGVTTVRFLLTGATIFAALRVSWWRATLAAAGRLLFSTLFALCTLVFDRVLLAAGLTPSLRLAALFLFCTLLLAGSVWYCSALVFGREAVNLLIHYSLHLPRTYARRLQAYAGDPLVLPL
ncbi:MAG TPA: oligosaccharide flippase family protein [Acidobacteriaceae bacterium]